MCQLHALGPRDGFLNRNPFRVITSYRKSAIFKKFLLSCHYFATKLKTLSESVPSRVEATGVGSRVQVSGFPTGAHWHARGGTC